MTGDVDLFGPLRETLATLRRKNGSPARDPHLLAKFGSAADERDARKRARARGDLGGIYQRWRSGIGTLHPKRKDALKACPGVAPVLVTGIQDGEYAHDRSRRAGARVTALPIRVAPTIEQLQDDAFAKPIDVRYDDVDLTAA